MRLTVSYLHDINLLDFDQICMGITLGHDEDGELDLIVNVTGRLKLPNLSQKVLVCMLFHEPLAGMLPNLHVYVIGAHHRMVWVVGDICFL